MNKKILVLVVLGIIAMVLSLGTANVAAQGPTNTYPGGASGLDNQFHNIPANTHLWYFFEYSGDNTQFSIVLVGGAKDKLDFNLYLPTQVTLPDQWVTNPIGRGSQPGIACPSFGGSCDQDNKIWLGGFNISGRYYVEVINNNAQNLPFLLQIVGGGDSIALHPPTATSAAAAVAPVATRTQPRAVAPAAAAPNAILTVMAQVAATLEAPAASLPSSSTAGTATPQTTSTPQAATTPQPTTISQAASPTATPSITPTPGNTWWTSALYVVDDRRRVIAPKADLWFKFDYGGDKSQITIRIPDAKLSQIEFKIYTGDQVVNYETVDKFIGAGSPPRVACDSGSCDSNELSWLGSFGQGGTYFIRVTNTSDKYANFVLVVSGSNVSLGS
jgi:hypothetical protein